MILRLKRRLDASPKAIVSRFHLALFFLAFISAIPVGCVADSPTDAGTTDVAQNDAGARTDAGPLQSKDAGNATDAGETDAGETDAGETDAGLRTECPTEGCDDQNPCTVDSCNESTGYYCMNIPVEDNTDCSSSCQPQALCIEGVCDGDYIGGINDYNPCTRDSCNPLEPVGSNILHEPLFNAPCLNTNQCRESGICRACPSDAPASCDVIMCDGEAGALLSCDDGNDCTKDQCDPNAGGCQNSQILTENRCRPFIIIDYPARGATIAGPAGVQRIPLMGSIFSNLGEIVEATANGFPLELDENNNLAVAENGLALNWLPVDVGVNVLIIDAKDNRGQQQRRVQTFMWANKYTAPDSSGLSPNLADDTMGIYLDSISLDDKSHSLPPDDIATLFESGLQQDFNISTMLGIFDGLSFSYEGTVYENAFNTANTTHQPIRVNLDPREPFGMHLRMTLSDIRIPLSLPTSQGFSSTAYLGFEDIVFDADLIINACKDNLVSIDPTIDQIACENGKVFVTPIHPDVTLGAPTSVTGVAGADNKLEDLLTTYLNILEGSFTNGYTEVLNNDIAPIIGDIFSAFNFTQSIELAGLGDGDPISILMVSTVFEETFTASGGLFRLRGGASARSTIELGTSLGVPEVSACQGSSTDLVAQENAPVELLITDTMLNQIFYAAWSAGLLKFPVNSAEVFTNLSDDVQITNIQMDVEGLAPPTATACTPDGELLFHIGDLKINMSFDLDGQPVTATAHTSFSTQLILEPSEDNTKILIKLGELRVPSARLDLNSPINTDIEIEEDEQIDIGPVVINLINENLVDSMLSGFSDGFGAIPIPQFDISGIADGNQMRLEQFSVEPIDGGTNTDSGTIPHIGNTTVVNAKFIGEQIP